MALDRLPIGNRPGAGETIPNRRARGTVGGREKSFALG